MTPKKLQRAKVKPQKDRSDSSFSHNSIPAKVSSNKSKSISSKDKGKKN